jgi:hypothetical protein
MIRVAVDGMADLEKRIQRAVQFGEINKQDASRAYRKISQIFVRKAKAMIKPYPRIIQVSGRKRSTTYVHPGQLRDSMGTWSPDNKFPTVLAGPRANFPMKRKVRATADAWFAHIVEEGDFPAAFGGKSTSHPNYKVMERAMQATEAQMRAKLQQELAKLFAKMMR